MERSGIELRFYFGDQQLIDRPKIFPRYPQPNLPLNGTVADPAKTTAPTATLLPGMERCGGCRLRVATRRESFAKISRIFTPTQTRRGMSVMRHVSIVPPAIGTVGQIMRRLVRPGRASIVNKSNLVGPAGHVAAVSRYRPL